MPALLSDCFACPQRGQTHFSLLASNHLVHIIATDETRQRDVSQKIIDLITEFRPEFMCQATFTVLAVLAAAALGGVDALADGGDDLGNGNVLRVAGQPIAAARTTQALDQTMPLEAGKQLLEIGQRDTLIFGDSGKGHRPFGMVNSQIQHGRYSITALCR